MIALLTLMLSLAHADTLASCHDGDTCRFKTPSGIVNVRLASIDAPESKQAYGSRATAYLTKLLTGNDIRLECVGKSHKRKVCLVFAGGEDVQLKMVEAGWAWDYPQFSKGKYRAAEQKARAEKLGLWTDPKPTSPFCFRKKKAKQCKHNFSYQP